MPHVGVQRLAAGHGQDDGPEREEALPGMAEQELDRVDRIERRQHRRRVQDADHAQHRQHAEPGAHDRAEEAADRAGAVFLDREQDGQDNRGDRHDVVLERRRDHVQALDRAEHRDGRGDHAVAVEQRGGEDAEHGHEPGGRRIPGQLRDAGEQGQAAALAPVVGPHDDGDVFQGHQRHDGPENQRQNAENARRLHRDGVMPGEGFLERVQGAGADVAEDDPDGADDQRRRTALLSVGRHFFILLFYCFFLS